MTIKTAFQTIQRHNWLTFRHHGIHRVALLLVSVLTVWGCSPRSEPEQSVHVYAARLANVLAIDPPEITSASFPDIALQQDSHFAPHYIFRPRLPKIENHPEASHTLSLREFQQLPDCHQLKPIVAQQNSSLGRVQSPSQRYLYQVNVVSLLAQCIERAKSTNQPTSQLNSIYEAKLQDLTHSRYWFLRTESAIRRSLAFSATLIEPDWKQHLQTTSHWQILASSPGETSEFPIDIAALTHKLNTALHHVESNPFPTQLYNTLHWYSFQIATLNTWLTAHLIKENCTSPKSKTRVDYLANIVKLFFIDDIQTQGSKLSELHYRLQPALKTIYKENLKEAGFSHLIATHQVIFENYQHNMKSHTIIWNKLFKRCKVTLKQKK